jgi:hypothetical protein
MSKKKLQWAVTGNRPPIKRRLGRVYCDGLVHLVTGWIVFDMETNFDMKDGGLKPANPGRFGTSKGSYEETLCGIAFPMGDRPPRTSDSVTCVACLANTLMSTTDVEES